MTLRASPAAKSLAHVQRLLAAGRGGRGSSQKRRGAIGHACIVDVPLGTVVYRDAAPGQPAAKPADENDSGGSSGGDGTGQHALDAAAAAAAPFGLTFDDGSPAGSGVAAGGPFAGTAVRHHPPSRSVDGPAGIAATAADAAAAAAAAESLGPAAEAHPQHAAAEAGGMANANADAAAPAAAAAAARPDLPVVADLVAEGDEVVVAVGGTGGRGNATYRNIPGRPASKRHETGQPGKH